VRDFVPGGCLFELTNPVEAYRVEKYGGEEEFTRLILEEVSATDVLYDIGACVGLVTVHAAVKGAHVAAFEPDPGFRCRLETNLRLNHLNSRQVQVLDWAVSDSRGNVLLYTDGIAGKSPSLRGTSQRGQIPVRTASIDDAIEQHELPVPDILKIDIEGAEILALRGMRQLLTSAGAPRAIFIEIHPGFLPSFGSSVEEVKQLLESAEYSEHYEASRADQIHCVFTRRRGDG
jgi:FkbM family methyltransferase